MIEPQAVLDCFRARLDGMTALLGELVRRESPSTDKQAVDALADFEEARLRELPLAVERLARERAGDILLARRRPDDETKGRAVLLLSHMDTVWPAGTLAQRPFRVDGDAITGPGCLDDKSGQVLVLAMLRGLGELGIRLARPVTVLFNGDEESGSVASRSAIEAEARRSDFVLCLEGSDINGELKTSRKAVGGFVMRIAGKPAHAGAHPELGVSAIEELSRQVIDLHALNAPADGVTVNVGVVGGGTRSNVVPGEAWAQIDLRARTTEKAGEISRRILSSRPHLAGARVEVSGGIARPPMERTAQVAALFELTRRLGRRLGLTLMETASGGGSDASFAAALGVPCLDGLGAVGQGAHAENEWLSLSSLAERAALLTLLVEHLANRGLEPEGESRA